MFVLMDELYRTKLSELLAQKDFIWDRLRARYTKLLEIFFAVQSFLSCT
jgi:hypothetical protein